jgi:serine/threonine-protein kinase
MQRPDQPTAEDLRSVPAVAAPERVRAALVVGPRAQTDDFHRLLRRRLLVLSLFLAAVISSLTVLSLITYPTVETLVENVQWFALIGTNLVAAWVLSRRPPRSMQGLRLLESMILGPLVISLLLMGVGELPYRPLEWAGREAGEYRGALVGRYANAGGGLWFMAITIYGALVPNTFRRAALVTGGMAVAPLMLFAGFAYGLRPLDPRIAGEVLSHLAATNAIAVGLVLFSTSRIEVLRHQASEARRFGQYVLKEKLGGGGMGEVYRAEHALLRRPAAIKLIRTDRASDPDTIRRFQREVQITATLTHPNTVQVFDYGHAEDGTFYYVMEYLPGMTLEEIVRRHGPLPPNRAVHFLRQVCAALDEAHAHRLIHRDIKPGNVIVCERGGVPDVAKVLDFGLVHVPRDADDGATLTRAGTVAGTPAFMSPEQAGGEGTIDPRSDLYSVGALAYFLLAGVPPFPGRSAARMMAAHLYEIPAALPSGVPPDLAAVVMRSLAKEPAERWPSAACLEAALAATAMPAWDAGAARTWWAQVGRDRDTGAPVATATWDQPDAIATPRFEAERGG